jgi:hypothetical protein
MRRGVLVLLPVVASCGLLMDFEPGGGAGGDDATTSTGLAPSTSTGEGGASASASSGSVSGSTSSGDTPPASSSSSSGGGDGPLSWASTFGSSGDDHLRALAVSSDGRIAVAGDFQGAMSFAVGTPLEAAEGYVGTFVAVYSAEGTPEWAKKITEYVSEDVSEHNDTIDIAFSGTDLVVSGTFTSFAYVQQGSPEPFETADAVPKVFAAMLAGEDGAVRWGTPFGADGAPQIGGWLAVRDDEIFMAGSFCGELDFRNVCVPLVAPDCTELGQANIWVVELNQQGACQRARSFGAPGTRDVALDIDVFGTDLALVGDLNGELDLGGGVTLQPADIANETFVAVLDQEWNGIDGAMLGQRGRDVSVVFDQVDAGDLIRFTGSLDPFAIDLRTPPFGAGDFVTGRMVIGGDLFVDAAFGSSSFETGFVRRTQAGRLRAYGGFESAADFGLREPVDHDDARDAFAATLSADGEVLDGVVEVFGGGSEQVLVAAAFDPDGNEILAGHLDQATDIDDHAITSLNGGLDIFVVARGKRPP